MSKRVLIIGGGISGLTAGVYAAKAGYETHLYEQQAYVGGECTGWDRGGYHIDNCIHWMNGTAPGDSLNRLWQDIGALGPETEIIHPDRMYTSELGGEEITLWKDIDRTERELLELSPEDEQEIKKLMHFCRLGGKVRIPAEKPPEMQSALDGIRLMLTMVPALKIFKEYKGMDTRDLMERFQHPLIRCMISDFCTRESMASSFPLAYGSFAAGDGGIPRGGSREMAVRIGRQLVKCGGKIHTGKRAEEILLKDGRAVGIRFLDKTAAEGEYVIPACYPQVTFGRLLSENYMPELLREMYDNREAYPVYTTFQAAYSLDSSADLIGADRILDGSGLDLFPGLGERINVKSYAYEPSFAPDGKHVIQVLTGGPEALYKSWAELYREREAYLAKKNQMAEDIRKLLEQRFPECCGKLALLDCWTPMTYERYCSAYKGFYQSCTVTKQSSRLPYPERKVDGLENVYLAGQWQNPPGGLPGAAIAGKYAVQRMIKEDIS